MLALAPLVRRPYSHLPTASELPPQKRTSRVERRFAGVVHATCKRITDAHDAHSRAYGGESPSRPAVPSPMQILSKRNVRRVTDEGCSLGGCCQDHL